MSILFIVESAGKISEISKILGDKYIIKTSVGHIRNLYPKKMSIDFENHFEPIYVITRPDVVKNLEDAMKNVNMVYLAADADREGEAIAQSLYDVLKPKKYKRLRYNAITKEAITNAIKDAGDMDINLVNAQKARRVLDRLYGFSISPILQKQIGGKLSAGRVQSVAVKIVIDKEDEINKFINKNKNSSYFKAYGFFIEIKFVLYELTDKNSSVPKTMFKGKPAHIPIIDTDNPNAKVIIFMKRCLKSEFTVHSVSDKTAIRSAAPPFTTSTLQQDANRKFGMSIDSIMKTAQQLYEGGYITYMRTDSVEISPEGHNEIKKVIINEYGDDFYQKNVYKNKSANAQEAHEAIRPTHPDILSLNTKINDAYQIKLYKLIWQRTIASQMKPAQINVVTIQVAISKFLQEKIQPFYFFQSQIEKIIFPGFMKVYTEHVDNPEDDDTTKNFTGKIPSVNDILVMEEIIAKQEYLKPPFRYSEASLVKKLEDLGIGRPSTFVSTIQTIIKREYVKISDVRGTNKEIITYSIKSKNNKHIMSIFEETSIVSVGKETKKIIPTSLGITVNDFLIKYFSEMLDYKFTAKMESELDLIANGEKIWYEVVQNFYDKLKPTVDELNTKENLFKISERLLGTDNDGNEIYATKTKYGPVVKKKMGSKFIYAKIKDISPDDIDLQTAIELFKYPKLLGEYNKKDVFLQKGEFGFYIVYEKNNYKLPDATKSDINLNEAIEIIKTSEVNLIAKLTVKDKANKKIEVVILNGKFGPYIQINQKNKKINYAIPKNIDPTNLTEEQILEIISKKKTFSKKYNKSKQAQA